jgi:hypothetical protein
MTTSFIDDHDRLPALGDDWVTVTEATNTILDATGPFGNHGADSAGWAVLLARHNDGAAMKIETMSTDGAVLMGPVTLTVGERVQVQFEVDGVFVEVSADVVGVDCRTITSDHIAIRFVGLSDETRARLRSLTQSTQEPHTCPSAG